MKEEVVEELPMDQTCRFFSKKTRLANIPNFLAEEESADDEQPMSEVSKFFALMVGHSIDLNIPISTVKCRRCYVGKKTRTKNAPTAL